MIFAAPLAAILRGLLINAPVIPIFAVVLSATSAFGMLIWRGIYLFLSRKPQ
jgi:ABC-type xylose transport system permease subunit